MATMTVARFHAIQAQYGLRIYGAWAGNEGGTKEDVNHCQADVPRGFMLFGQCSRKRGHGEGGDFCKQHGKRSIAGGMPASVLVERNKQNVNGN